MNDQHRLPRKKKKTLKKAINKIAFDKNKTIVGRVGGADSPGYGTNFFSNEILRQMADQGVETVVIDLNK